MATWDTGGSVLLVLTILAAAGVTALVAPFRRLVAVICLASVATKVSIPVGEGSLRLEYLLLPIGLLGGMLQGQLGRLGYWASRPTWLLLGAWVAVGGVVSATTSPDPGASLFIVAWFGCNLLIVLLALAAYGDDRDGLERVLLAAAVLAASAGILGWVQAYLTGRDSWGAGMGPSGLRASGVSIEPNILAGTAAIWVLIALTAPRGRHARWVLLPLVAVLPLASTRAAVAALAVGLGVYALARPGVLSRLVLPAFAAVGTLLCIYLVSPENLTAIWAKISNFEFDDYSSTYRYLSWRLAINDLNGVDWLFGLGTNSFQQRHLSPTSEFFDREGFYLAALPLQVLYDTGLVGCLLVGSAALALLRGGHVSRRVAVLAAFTVISVATSPFFFANWWLLIALGLASSRLRDERDVGHHGRVAQRPGDDAGGKVGLAADDRTQSGAHP